VVGEVIGRSFSGTPYSDPERTLHWIYGEEFQDFNSPTRQTNVRQIFTWVSRVMGMKGAVLGDYGENGELHAVLVSRRATKPPSDSEDCCTHCAVCCGGSLFCELCCTFCCRCTGPSLAPVGKRADDLEKTMQQMHADWAPGEHVYVAVMAVHPDFQGKGACSRLMRTVERAADNKQLPCYLEASGERNVAIYSHLGYDSKKVYPLTDRAVEKKDPESVWKSYDQFHAMVRPPAPPG